MDNRSSRQQSDRQTSLRHSGSRIAQAILKSLFFAIGMLLLAGCTEIAEEQLNRFQVIELPQVDLDRLNPNGAVRSGLIAYIGPSGNVYTIDQQGERLTQITVDGNLNEGGGGSEDDDDQNELIFHTLPTWSPAEQRLLFSKISVDRSDRSTINRSVTALADGSDVRELSSSPFNNIYFYWSPDGQQIAALTLAPANTLKLQQLGLNLENDEDRIFDIGQPFYFDWSPDSQQMLIHVGSNNVAEKVAILGVTTEDLSAPTRLEEVLDIAPARFTAPDWSPDGHSILFPRFALDPADDDTVLVSRNLRSRSDRIIAKYDGSVRMNAAWSPTNRHISFIPSREAERVIGRLFVMDAATKRQIQSEHDDVVAYFWSPNGTKVAYISLVEGNGDLGGETGENRTTPADIPVQFGPQRANQFGLFVLDLESGQTTPLLDRFSTTQNFFSDAISFFDQYQRSATIWSPNSQYVVVPIQNEGKSEIVVFDATGRSAPTPIAEGVLAYWSWVE